VRRGGGCRWRGDGAARHPAIQQVAFGVASVNPNIVLRIGIHLGDIVFEGDDIYGNGVNIAARLEPLSQPGGICISSIVNESVNGRIETVFIDGGDVHVKNIDRPLKVFHWHPEVLQRTGIPGTTVENTAYEYNAADTSIAVLPFENMSGDAEQEYFSDGISEDIITDLSKISDLSVTARNSSFAYKGKSVDLRQIGQDLGVNSILEGSVRRAGNRVRITAQLIDAKTGNHIWAERYDRNLTDIFAVQDEVTFEIVNALKVKLTPEQREHIVGTGTTNVEAHDHYLRARSLLFTPDIDAALFKLGVESLERAIEIDDNYAQPHSLLAIFRVVNFLNQFVKDGTEMDLILAGASANRGVELNPNEFTGRHAVAIVARWNGNLQLAMAEVETALKLSPDQARAYFTRGEILVALGQHKEGIVDLEHAIRLDPAYNHQYLHYLGLAHLLLGHYETAAVMFRERLLFAKNSDIARAMLSATLGHLGELEEARQIWDDLMTLNPDFSMKLRLEKLAFADPLDVRRIQVGLENAGLKG
jgi:adenylate cyclase